MRLHCGTPHLYPKPFFVSVFSQFDDVIASVFNVRLLAIVLRHKCHAKSLSINFKEGARGDGIRKTVRTMAEPIAQSGTKTIASISATSNDVGIGTYGESIGKTTVKWLSSRVTTSSRFDNRSSSLRQ
jgi:hypothetical protein